MVTVYSIPAFSYNTEDPRCYHDLARLRGLEYVTWEKGDKVWAESEVVYPNPSSSSS